MFKVLWQRLNISHFWNILRFIGLFFGMIFTTLTLGGLVSILVLAAIIFTYSHDLPDHKYLLQYEPDTISRVYSSEGFIMDEFARERRIFTPIDDIPSIVQAAFISAEDKNFYIHKGYDLLGIGKAIIHALQGGQLRGASTITQQVAKNFLLTNERTARRKIKEIILSARIENSLSKKQILEIYLNDIFLGQNSYGVTAAIETYFGKSLKDLNLSEAAYLAVLPKAPNNYHPVRNHSLALARRNFVLKEMQENNYISLEAMKTVQKSDFKTVQNGSLPSLRSTRPYRNYFTDEIRRQLSHYFGAQEFFTGGYLVRATIDYDLQLAAEQALRNGLEAYDRRTSPYYGAIDSIETVKLESSEQSWRTALKAIKIPRDIEDWYAAVVLAIDKDKAWIGIEGFKSNKEIDYLDFKQENKWAKNRQIDNNKRIRVKSAFDMWAVGDVVLVKPERDENDIIQRWTLRQIPKVQGGFVAMDTNTGRVLAMQGGFSYQHSVFNRSTQANRQLGSVFKPFVYTAALDSGYSPVSIIVDAPIAINTPQGLWLPKNASNKYYGPAPLRLGIEYSRNLMTIRLAQHVGMDIIGDYAEHFGLYSTMQPVLAAALGSQESTLYKVVTSYAMFANGGERIEPTLVDRVQDRHGKTIFRHDKRICQNCNEMAIDSGRGLNIISNRERVINQITAYRIVSMLRGVVERGTARHAINLDAVIAGKTGTTNEAKDVWFVGFTRNIVAGCYIGYDSPRTLGRNASGGALCAPVFQQFMRKAIEKYDAGNFEQPANTRFYNFDRQTGQRLNDDDQGEHVVQELFDDTEVPKFNAALNPIDGGFEASVDFSIYSGFARGQNNDRSDKVIETISGKKTKIPAKATFGTLSSGGLY